MTTTTNPLPLLQALAAQFKEKLFEENRHAGKMVILQVWLSPSQLPLAQNVPEGLREYVERNDGKILRIAIPKV